MTAPRTEADLAGPPPTLAGSLRQLARPVAEASVQGLVLALVVPVVMGLLTGWDLPWLSWGLGCGLFLLVAVPRLLPALAGGLSVGDLSPGGALVAVLLVTGAVAVLGGLAAAVLTNLQAPPPEIGGTAWEQGLLVLAAGLWCVCWMVAMIFLFVVLPVGLALAAAILLVLVGIVGAMAPALLPDLGTPAVAAGLRFSPVVTLPALALMLCVLGRGQRTAASQEPR